MTEIPVKDIRVEVRVRNNLILKAVEDAGYKSLMAFCKDHPDIAYSTALQLVAMRSRPVKRIPSKETDKGEWHPSFYDWTPTVKKLAMALGVLEKDLFSKEQIDMEPLVKNTLHVVAASSEARGWLTGSAEQRALPPDQKLLATDLSHEMEDVLDSLTPREGVILRMRFGVCGEKKHTLEELAAMFNVSRERIRQIESKALRKTRHPSRARKLKPFLDIEKEAPSVSKIL